MEAHENIEMHSEELREVLGTPPKWLVRWGTVIAVLAFCTLIAVAYFVKYPDVIIAPLVITAPNPPVDLVAERNGLFEAVLVNDGEEVEEGDLILVYASTANLMDIDTLEADLKYFSGELYASDLERFIPIRQLQLGDLQDEYAEFLKNFDAFVYGSISKNDQKSINRLNNNIRSIETSIKIEEEKKDGILLRENIANNELERIRKNYSSDPDKYRDLLGQNAQKIKDLQQEFKNVESLITRKRLEINDLRKDIAEIRQQSGADKSNLIFAISENIDRLKGKIKTWKKENLIFARIDGQVSFYQEFDNENQSVQIGTKILKIIPPGEVGEMYGKVDLPQAGSGKVDIGQEVIIKLKNYPFHEYGVLTGLVKTKSDIPQEDNTYKVEVDLANGLQTSFGKELNFTQGMQGSAEIITKERRFLFRIFENVFDF